MEEHNKLLTCNSVFMKFMKCICKLIMSDAPASQCCCHTFFCTGKHLFMQSRM